MKFWKENESLCWKHQYETVKITPWGRNALRVRTTKYPNFTDRNWALDVLKLYALGISPAPAVAADSVLCTTDWINVHFTHVSQIREHLTEIVSHDQTQRYFGSP